MMKKKLLFILFAVFLSLQTLTVCSAAGTAAQNNIDMPSVFVYEQNVTKTKNSGGLLFLFSGAELSARHNGYIVSFFSDIEVNGDFRGEVYSFFSTVTFTETAGFDGEINTFSSDIAIARGQADKGFSIRGISVSDLFMTERSTDTYIRYTNRIPFIAFQALLGVFNICACIVLFFIKKSFMQQASVLLQEEPLEVIRNGIAVYFVIIGLILLCALTVFLMPLMFIGFLVAYVMVLIGESALAVYIGYMIADAIHYGKDRRGSVYDGLKLSSFACMVIGVTGIETLKLIPVIGLSVSYLFLPLITIGMLSTAFGNGFLRKLYYETPYIYDNYKKDYDIHAIRDMILGRGAHPRPPAK